ncbi:MAG TPA: trypsin-like peptidase domain-containing protein [Verrucomicrobiae bacterium]|nr:trypsin-like peptidase domain-containing protein [Verrucomicrobiae bacterium]
MCYQNGTGVPKDYVEAYKWYNLASSQGDQFAKEKLSSLQRQRTSYQIAEAQELSRGFKPHKEGSTGSISSDQPVASVGFPDPGLQGFAPKLAKGEIASLSGAGDDVRYFQIRVPVQPGNSGGALVDEHGNVVGIVSAKLDASVALAARCRRM